MSNPGYASNIRFPLRPDSPGVIPLTTVPQIVCDPPGTGDTRNILAASRVYNRSDANSGGGPCGYTFYYATTDITDSNDLTPQMECGGSVVGARDMHQLGDLPIVPGYQLWAKADANNYLNLLLVYEEVE